MGHLIKKVPLRQMLIDFYNSFTVRLAVRGVPKGVRDLYPTQKCHASYLKGAFFLMIS